MKTTKTNQTKPTIPNKTYQTKPTKIVYQSLWDTLYKFWCSRNRAAISPRFCAKLVCLNILLSCSLTCFLTLYFLLIFSWLELKNIRVTLVSISKPFNLIYLLIEAIYQRSAVLILELVEHPSTHAATNPNTKQFTAIGLGWFGSNFSLSQSQNNKIAQKTM